jgi:hypothetical protein
VAVAIGMVGLGLLPRRGPTNTAIAKASRVLGPVAELEERKLVYVDTLDIGIVGMDKVLATVQYSMYVTCTLLIFAKLIS